VRQPASSIVLLILAACGPTPPRQHQSATDHKKASNQGRILVRDFLATPENCGMIHYVRQVYPKEAKKAGIQGVVRVAYTITKTGEVRDVRVLSGDPVLTPAAVAAVAKWRFAPCRVFGPEPIETKITAEIPFTLNQ
jgi:TonB family protein